MIDQFKPSSVIGIAIELKVQDQTAFITSMMYSDSRIKLDRTRVADLLREEGSFENMEDIELFCLGGGNGETPTDLVSAHPKLSDYIGSFF